MTVLSTHDLTVTGTQAARAWALTHLLEDKTLPAVTWTIGDLGDRLSGLATSIAPTDQIAAVAAWAEYLNSPVAEKRVRGCTEVSAEGWAYGVRVRIWARIRTTTPKEAAA